MVRKNQKQLILYLDHFSKLCGHLHPDAAATFLFCFVWVVRHPRRRGKRAGIRAKLTAWLLLAGRTQAGQATRNQRRFVFTSLQRPASVSAPSIKLLLSTGRPSSEPTEDELVQTQRGRLSGSREVLLQLFGWKVDMDFFMMCNFHNKCQSINTPNSNPVSRKFTKT